MESAEQILQRIQLGIVSADRFLFWLSNVNRTDDPAGRPRKTARPGGSSRPATPHTKRGVRTNAVFVSRIARASNRRDIPLERLPERNASPARETTTAAGSSL